MKKKKTDLQTQQRIYYTSPCLLWHFLALIIHHAFLPLLLGGSSWDCFTRKGEKRSRLPSSPPTITQALPRFVSFPPSLPLPSFIFLSKGFTLQRLRMGRSKMGTGYFLRDSSCALCHRELGLFVVAACEHAPCWKSWCRPLYGH